MKIRFIGDIHGDMKSYLKIIEGCTMSVQVGDMGAGFVELCKFENNDHRFIRGNHDDPSVCRKNPNWIEDGFSEVINDHRIMYIGGAFSIDHALRTPGKNWWFDEELNDYAFENLYEDYKGHLPEIMVTHDCPYGINAKVIPDQYPPYVPTRTTFWLKEMFAFHKPKFWVFGHHHRDYSEIIDGTHFICLGINSYIDLEIKGE